MAPPIARGRRGERVENLRKSVRYTIRKRRDANRSEARDRRRNEHRDRKGKEREDDERDLAPSDLFPRYSGVCPTRSAAIKTVSSTKASMPNSPLPKPPKATSPNCTFTSATSPATDSQRVHERIAGDFGKRRGDQPPPDKEHGHGAEERPTLSIVSDDTAAPYMSARRGSKTWRGAAENSRAASDVRSASSSSRL